ncbi:hypothetical protein MIZ01_1601 [Sideroxyarcus emersonii]|uniref:Uncharacterized protein n=1 Tax=Sideroxyarcus emersonii TaxID=2764705 RepID=A0AAN2BZ50_9PROT|nr:hypothetical protein [Sideroxyarcus emersonii]BCK87805.1 hypothetical protein MIZ01_1601 [Sideroxyarcus emersonii]
MKQKGSINRNFYRQPRVRALVPDLKLLLSVLFVSCESHIGCWLPAGLADDSGLSDEALAGGLAALEKEKFIEIDQETGEIFLNDFFRNNTFKTPQRVGQARSDFNVIESEKLRKKVLEKIELSPECGLKKSHFENNQQLNFQGEGEGKEEGKGEERERTRARGSDHVSFSKNQKQSSAAAIKESVEQADVKQIHETGLTIKTIEDQLLSEKLVEQYGFEKVKEAAVQVLIEQGAAWPSVAAKKLSGFNPNERGSKITKGKWAGFNDKNYLEGIGDNYSF